jgi:hypothetical protein
MHPEIASQVPDAFHVVDILFLNNFFFGVDLVSYEMLFCYPLWLLVLQIIPFTIPWLG